MKEGFGLYVDKATRGGQVESSHSVIFQILSAFVIERGHDKQKATSSSPRKAIVLGVHHLW